MVQGVVFVGVAAPVIAIVILIGIVGAWRARREMSEADRRRDDNAFASDILRREARLRRERNIRLGHLESDSRDAPRDPEEGVRVVGPDRSDST